MDWVKEVERRRREGEVVDIETGETHKLPNTDNDLPSGDFGTYYGSAEGEQISKKRALHELKRHGHEDPKSVAQFLAEMGDKETYDAQEVLRWLGY